LKQTCEDFILETTKILIDSISSFLLKASALKPSMELKRQTFAQTGIDFYNI
jgi:hypothetical protein